MKAIIKSVSPRICEKIASGDCTILVSKTAPKCKEPFKGYIYCTNGEMLFDVRREIYLPQKVRIKPFRLFFGKSNGALYPSIPIVNRKVIGEFICDKVIKTCGWRLRGNTQQCAKRTTAEEAFPKLACLTIDEIVKYAGSESREVCGLHISDLKIYDKPKELSEFKTPPCEKNEKACGNCKWLVKINTPDVYECECYVEDGRPITRAPQSWQYVEEL